MKLIKKMMNKSIAAGSPAAIFSLVVDFKAYRARIMEVAVELQ